MRFVRQRLCPWLHSEDIVLMDNLGVHKGRGVRQAIEAAGACMVYLPPTPLISIPRVVVGGHEEAFAQAGALAPP
ncbi:hypothetical protein HNV27_28280 [Myxococcus xanthus]|nr:hypothetical protein [Myxococcus xanthus]